MSVLKRFKQNKAGNFAMMTAVMLFPLLAGVGMAIDYTSISRNKAALQGAIDAAALYSGKYYKQNNKVPNNNQIEEFIRANFDGDLTSATVELHEDDIEVIAVSKAPGYFLSKAMPSAFVQTVDATVPTAKAPFIEIAMVLDTTYSMSADGKMTSLKTVAKNFVEELSKAADAANKISVGLVPFTNHVNVGTANRNQSWMNVPPDTSTTEYKCQMKTVGAVATNCRTETHIWDGVPTPVNVCDWTGGTQQEVCENVTTSSTWHGCVGSRPAPYTLRDSDPNVRFEGLMNTWCGSTLTPLTSNFGKLKNAIDAMNPTGDTYIAPGVMWGVRVLSDAAPFTESASLNATAAKAMIIMTDGDNQRSADLPNAGNWGGDLVQSNDWSKEACEYAKDQGITVFSIAFGTSVSNVGKAVMQECASSPDHYYSASDGAQLNKAFQDITDKILVLRLTS